MLEPAFSNKGSSILINDAQVELIEPVLVVLLRAHEGVSIRVVYPRSVTDVLDIRAFEIRSRHKKCLVVAKEPLEHLEAHQTSMFVLIVLVKYEILTFTHVSGVRTVYNLNLV